MSHHTPSMDALLDVVINSNRLTTFVDLCFVDMEGRLVMKRSCTVIQARLRDFSVDDLTESSLYPRVRQAELFHRH